MDRYRRLKARLDGGEVVVLDGATGTELQRRGAVMDPAAWCGPATLRHDRLLEAIHADYLAAGAEVITANTFAASRLMLKGAGLADRSEEIAERAVAAALRARDAAAVGSDAVVAGSLSHMVPLPPGSAAPDPAALPSEDEMAAAFGALAMALKSAGCELILLEMMYHPVRARLARDAALATGLPVWFGASARRGAAGTVVSFLQHEDLPLEAIAALIPSTGVDMAGVMHTEAGLITEALAVLARQCPQARMAYPESGYFEMPDWRFVDVLPPERFEAFCRGWIEGGVRVIGGCCGLGVDHVRAAARARAAARG